MPSVRLVSIPEGDFWMGSEPSGSDNERPRHRVWVPAFALGVCAVTVEEYAAFLGATGWEAPRGWGATGFDDPRQPVTGVSWLDAREWCEWKTAQDGRRFHLPTEAMRERAARGGKDALYPWGDEPLARVGPLPHPDRGGEDVANGYGLHDMGSNVHEWCADWYARDYYAGSPAKDPRGPGPTERRAARGGSWRHALPFSRCAARSALDPTKRFTDFGFRYAISPSFEYA